MKPLKLASSALLASHFILTFSSSISSAICHLLFKCLKVVNNFLIALMWYPYIYLYNFFFLYFFLLFFHFFSWNMLTFLSFPYVTFLLLFCGNLKSCFFFLFMLKGRLKIENRKPYTFFLSSTFFPLFFSTLTSLKLLFFFLFMC